MTRTKYYFLSPGLQQQAGRLGQQGATEKGRRATAAFAWQCVRVVLSVGRSDSDRRLGWRPDTALAIASPSHAVPTPLPHAPTIFNEASHQGGAQQPPARAPPPPLPSGWGGWSMPAKGMKAAQEGLGWVFIGAVGDGGGGPMTRRWRMGGLDSLEAGDPSSRVLHIIPMTS
jgi:hypothetical protein